MSLLGDWFNVVALFSLLQRLLPDEVRGRVAAAEMGGFMLALSASWPCFPSRTGPPPRGRFR